MIENNDTSSLEHNFPDGLHLGTALRFLTVYRNGKWGWEAEYSQGQIYGYRTRREAMLAAIHAAKVQNGEISCE